MKKYSSYKGMDISSRLREKMDSWKRVRREGRRDSSYSDDVERLTRENKSLMEKIRLERSVGQRMLQTIEKLKSQGSSSTFREENERLRRELQAARNNADIRVRQLIEENNTLLEHLDQVMSSSAKHNRSERRVKELEAQVNAMMVAQRKMTSMYGEEIEDLKRERSELRKHIDSMKTRITIMDAEREADREDGHLVMKLDSLKSQITIMEADHEVERREWEMERNAMIRDLRIFARREKNQQSTAERHQQQVQTPSLIVSSDREMASFQCGEIQNMMRNVEGVLKREIETKREFKSQVRAQVSQMERAMRRVRDALDQAQSREDFLKILRKESSNQCDRFVSILKPVMSTIQREIRWKRSYKRTVSLGSFLFHPFSPYAIKNLQTHTNTRYVNNLITFKICCPPYEMHFKMRNEERENSKI